MNTALDVGYISHLKVENTRVVSGRCIGVIVNTGDRPVDLATATVVSAYDDHADASFELTVVQTDIVLSPGQGGGRLNPLAEDLLVDAGLVTEPVVTSQFTLGYTLRNLVPGAYDIRAEASLDISGAMVTLPITFRVDSTGHGFGVSLLEARRLSSH